MQFAQSALLFEFSHERQLKKTACNNNLCHSNSPQSCSHPFVLDFCVEKNYDFPYHLKINDFKSLGYLNVSNLSLFEIAENGH